MKRVSRALVAIALLVTTIVTGSVAPASAGTLTSASFTSAGATTSPVGASNTRYDWAFRTASSGSLNRVSQSVPLGTSATGTRYLALAGNAAGNDASTPDTAANSITGDIDIRAKISLPSWSPATEQSIVSKWIGSGTTRSYLLSMLAGGKLQFAYSNNGTATASVVSTTATGFAANTAAWVRTTVAANNSGSSYTNFYTSSDGVTWTPLGTQVVGSPITIYDGNLNLLLGEQGAGSAQLAGKIYYAEVRNGINGPVVAKFDPAEDSLGGSSWTSSSSSGETWSIRVSGTVMPADIAVDLTVVSVTGIPSTGTAMLRTIDDTVMYQFTSTSVPSGTASTMALSGFINTSTAGSYTSNVVTYNGASAVDTVTAYALTIINPVNNTVNATIDPTFTFTVANQPTACNGESNFVSSAGNATGISLGHVGVNANVSGGQALTVASNAGGGFTVYVRGTQSSQNLRSASRNWTDVAGTYATPAALGSGEAFGYTYKDSTASSNVTNPVSATFAALDITNRAVGGSSTSATGNSCVSFDAQTASTTTAGNYSATIVYTALPTF